MINEVISEQVRTVVAELIHAGDLRRGMQIVVGCSTSEITGGQIGKSSSPEMGEYVAGAFLNVCKENGLLPLFQCCEHLNRALVMEREVAVRFGYTIVRAVPQPKAGGSVPSAAFRMLGDPVLCEKVQADAGIDIGDTIIGMHLRPVAVPVRGSIKRIGEANLVMAYTRPPYIGGERAVYQM